DTGGDGDKVAAASRSTGVPKDRAGLSLEGGDGEACNSPTANKAKATHMSASTAIVRERMAERMDITADPIESWSSVMPVVLDVHGGAGRGRPAATAARDGVGRRCGRGNGRRARDTGSR